MQYAHNLVDTGGKIDVLENGDYGPLNILKSVDMAFAGTGVALASANSSFPIIKTVISDNAGFGLRAYPYATNVTGAMDRAQFIGDAMGGARSSQTPPRLSPRLRP